VKRKEGEEKRDGETCSDGSRGTYALQQLTRHAQNRFAALHELLATANCYHPHLRF